MIKHIFTKLVIPSLVGLTIATGCSQPHPLVGQAAPDFELEDLSGRKVTMAQQRGSVVLVNFWAVGCGPCREEIPHLKQLQEKYGKDGLRVLGINAWDEPVDRIKSFVEKEKLPYTILPGGRRVLSDSFQGRSIPHSFLIDRTGKVVWSELGFEDGTAARLEQQVSALVKQ